jgi:hypothetical protein
LKPVTETAPWVGEYNGVTVGGHPRTADLARRPVPNYQRPANQVAVLRGSSAPAVPQNLPDGKRVLRNNTGTDLNITIDKPTAPTANSFNTAPHAGAVEPDDVDEAGGAAVKAPATPTP